MFVTRQDFLYTRHIFHLR